MKRTTIMLIGFVALVLITLLTTIYITGKASADTEPRLSNVARVVEPKTGIHSAVWKFWDNNRECYFVSGGGIWCTP